MVFPPSSWPGALFKITLENAAGFYTPAPTATREAQEKGAAGERGYNTKGDPLMHHINNMNNEIW